MPSSLHCHSNFSLLDGFSSPEENLKRASELGLKAIVYVPSEGYFWGIKNEKSEEFGMDLDIPDIWSPAQLADL